MANPYGITLDDASLRWAAAEGVSEAVIAAICLLPERSVDKIVAKLSPVELERVIKIVGRSPRGYAPGAYDALKGERHRRSTEPPAQRLSPKAAAKEQAGRVREDTDRLRGGHTRRPMGLSADGRQSAAERGADAEKTGTYSGTRPGTRAETVRRRMIVGDLMKLDVSVRGISAGTDIPRSSVHRAMRAIARAEAKKEVAVAEIAKELLGKRLRRGGRG
jgi:hypothetical protein